MKGLGRGRELLGRRTGRLDWPRRACEDTLVQVTVLAWPASGVSVAVDRRAPAVVGWLRSEVLGGIEIVWSVEIARRVKIAGIVIVRLPRALAIPTHTASLPSGADGRIAEAVRNVDAAPAA